MTNRQPFPTKRRGPFEGLLHPFELLLPFSILNAVACTVAHVEADLGKMADAANARAIADAIHSAEASCPMQTSPARQDPAVSPPQVFVEAFLFELPSHSNFRLEAGTVTSVSRVPGAKLLATPSLLTSIETQRTVDLGRRYFPPGAAIEPGLHFDSVTILPRFGSPGTLVVDVDVALQTSQSGQVAGVPSESHVRNTFVLRDRRVTWLEAPVSGYASGRVLLGLKPYLVTNQADLRDIFLCKVQQRRPSPSRR